MNRIGIHPSLMAESMMLANCSGPIFML
jgi:hypothetical protein